MAKWEQYWLEGDQGSPVEGFRPCPVGGHYNSLPSLVTSFVLAVLATATSTPCPLPGKYVSHIPLYISLV